MEIKLHFFLCSLQIKSLKSNFDLEAIPASRSTEELFEEETEDEDEEEVEPRRISEEEEEEYETTEEEEEERYSSRTPKRTNYK